MWACCGQVASLTQHRAAARRTSDTIKINGRRLGYPQAIHRTVHLTVHRNVMLPAHRTGTTWLATGCSGRAMLSGGSTRSEAWSAGRALVHPAGARPCPSDKDV